MLVTLYARLLEHNLVVLGISNGPAAFDAKYKGVQKVLNLNDTKMRKVEEGNTHWGYRKALAVGVNKGRYRPKNEVNQQ